MCGKSFYFEIPTYLRYFLTPHANSEMYVPILVTRIKMQPHNSQSSRDNAVVIRRFVVEKNKCTPVE